MPGDTGRTTRQRGGFTLLEAMMASAILFAVVVSVTMAMTSGQQHAQEAKQRIAASIAAEELMGRIVALDIDDSATRKWYDDVSDWNDFREWPGEMVDGNGDDFGPKYRNIGRTVTVLDVSRQVPELSVNVNGKLIQVRAYDASQRTLVELERFVPEPQS